MITGMEYRSGLFYIAMGTLLEFLLMYMNRIGIGYADGSFLLLLHCIGMMF